MITPERLKELREDVTTLGKIDVTGTDLEALLDTIAELADRASSSAFDYGAWDEANSLDELGRAALGGKA